MFQVVHLADCVYYICTGCICTNADGLHCFSDLHFGGPNRGWESQIEVGNRDRQAVHRVRDGHRQAASASRTRLFSKDLDRECSRVKDP